MPIKRNRQQYARIDKYGHSERYGILTHHDSVQQYTTDYHETSAHLDGNGVNPLYYKSYAYKNPLVSVGETFGYRDHRISRFPPTYDLRWYHYEGQHGDGDHGDLDGKPWDSRFPDRVVAIATNKLLGKLASGNYGAAIGEIPETINQISLLTASVLQAYRLARKPAGYAKAKAISDQIDSLRKRAATGLTPKVRRRARDEVSRLKKVAKPHFKVLKRYDKDVRKASRMLGIIKPKGQKMSDSFHEVFDSGYNVWFAMKFGWLPMLDDIYNHSIDIQKALAAPEWMSDYVDYSEDVLITPRESAGRTITKVDDCRKGCRVGVSYKIANREVYLYNQLGLTNPLLIAWELVPMSFVFDWFIPFGSFLNGLSAPMGLEFVHGYRTRYAYGKFTYEMPWISGYPEYTVEHKVETCGMIRFPLFDFPYPRLVFNFRPKGHMLVTALGLINQRL